MADGVFVITADNSAFLDLLDDKRKVKLFDAIRANLRGETPDGMDEATSIVYRTLAKDSTIYITARALPLPPSNQDLITEESKKENKKKVSKDTKEKKERNDSALLEDPAVGEAWKRFSRMREEIGKPLSTVARTRNLRTLERLSNGDTVLAEKILQQSVDKLWEGLYEPQKDYRQTRTSQTLGQRSPKIQQACGFSTERQDVDYNKLAWEQIQKQWESEDED